MRLASFVSLHLARFDTLRAAGEVCSQTEPGLLFFSVAADTRAAGTEPVSHMAFVFVLMGLHEDEASANRTIDRRRALAPWFDEAREVYSAVLQPFRHKGEANYLDKTQPGPVFKVPLTPTQSEQPFVAITSSGWNVTPGLDLNRVREFSTGVMAVRMAMTAVPGLHSQQSFFFPRGLESDPMTISFWRDEISMQAFSHGPGVHRLQMLRDREQKLADRVSFTRCSRVRTVGTWYGVDPLQSCGTAF